MLKFIQNRQRERMQTKIFQNILCWSLSLSAVVSAPNLIDFKTSYVEVYHFFADILQQIYNDFKTSYVEVYLVGYAPATEYSLFQNILCWSLSPHFLVTFISFYLFSPSFFLISIIFTKHQPIFFFLSNISQIPRLYNTFSTFFFFSPGKYFYNSQSGMGCSSDVFTTENAWS